uniref:D-lactate dehydrogenase (cytochrome) n=1 Tax=Aureoumbra lagunensis TaxID=44058 RepID=A0A7S3JZT6_9STRA
MFRPCVRRLAPYGRVTPGVMSTLESICQCTDNPSVLERHGKDESYHECIPPSVVAFPEQVDEIQAIVRLCAEKRIPIIPYGTGTSLEGHIQALEGGITLDLGVKMNHILDENTIDMVAKVQAGVTRKQLNTSLRYSGLEFAVDPGADASLGGMVACAASGTMAMSKGTMRENTLGLEVILPDGKLAQLGGRTKKSSAGYDLTRLFVGSEGTLGIITNATLRLHPLPARIAAIVVAFDGVRQAAEAVIYLLAMCSSGVLRRCEFLDPTTIRAFNHYQNYSDESKLPERATLFIELGDATQELLFAHIEIVRDLCLEIDNHAHFNASMDPQRSQELWAARHRTYYASLALKPNGKAVVTDTCVPLSQFAQVVQETVNTVHEFNIIGPVFGHAGDGNIHAILVHSDEDDEEYMKRIHECNARIVDIALAHGGTCTGEHGVGVGKIPYLKKQYPPPTIEAMATVKRAFDPLNIMNPGKIIL